MQRKKYKGNLRVKWTRNPEPLLLFDLFNVPLELSNNVNKVKALLLKSQTVSSLHVFKNLANVSLLVVRKRFL